MSMPLGPRVAVAITILAALAAAAARADRPAVGPPKPAVAPPSTSPGGESGDPGAGGGTEAKGQTDKEKNRKRAADGRLPDDVFEPLVERAADRAFLRHLDALRRAALAGPRAVATTGAESAALDALARRAASDGREAAAAEADALRGTLAGSVALEIAYQDAAVAAGRGERLALEYRASARGEDASPDALFLLARASDARTAQPLLERAVARDPEHVRARLLLGSLHCDAGRPQEAVAHFEAARALAPALPAAWLGTAWAAHAAGEAAEVESALRRACECANDTLPAADLAAFLVHARRYDAAAQVLAGAGGRGDALVLLATGHLERVLSRDTAELRARDDRDRQAAADAPPADAGAPPPAPLPAPLERAQTAFVGAAQADAGLTLADALAAHVAVRRGALEEARTILAADVATTGTVFGALVAAELELESGELAAATQRLSRLVDSVPGEIEVHLLYGVALERSGELRPAERAYREAEDLDADDVLVLRALGAVEARQKRWREALALFQRVASLTSGERDALFDLALVQRAADRAKDAAATLETLVATDPADAASWRLLGRVCHRDLRRAKSRAIEAYRACLLHGGDDPEVSAWLGELTATK